MCRTVAPYRTQNLTGLGLVAAGKRHIKSGREYDQYFQLGGLQFTDPIVANGTTYRTLKEMEKVVKGSLSHTTAIAQKLKGYTQAGTSRNIYEFLYNHIQYELDKEGVEQIRTPLRTWHEKKADCDCFSVFISSILHNLGIPHAFRMTDYGTLDEQGKPIGWQHVYVVVPHNGKESGLKQDNGYTVIDPVLAQFNYEKPLIEKHDHFMERMPIQVLNGVGNTATCTKTAETNPYYPEFHSLQQIAYDGNVATEQLLTELGLPVANGYTDIGKPIVKTTINSKEIAFDTIITQAQADEIRQMALGTEATTQQAGIVGNGKNLGKIVLFALAGVGFLYAIRPTNKAKGSNNKGLSGTVSKNRKPKTATKKARILKLK